MPAPQSGPPALPPAARALAEAVTASVRAAGDGDLPRYAEATDRLALAEPEHVRSVLGDVVRSLLEELHPDGIDSDDVAEVVTGCVRAAARWRPRPAPVDPAVLVVLLAGALGVHPEDEAPRTAGPAAVARHAPLLVAHLLQTSGRRLAPVLASAFTEIARAEVVEMP